MSEYDKQKDIEAEGQRAAIFYHQMPKVGVCDHDWPGEPEGWDRSQEFVPICTKCGMSFIAHIHMEMP